MSLTFLQKEICDLNKANTDIAAGILRHRAGHLFMKYACELPIWLDPKGEQAMSKQAASSIKYYNKHRCEKPLTVYP